DSPGWYTPWMMSRLSARYTFSLSVLAAPTGANSGEGVEKERRRDLLPVSDFVNCPPTYSGKPLHSSSFVAIVSNVYQLHTETISLTHRNEQDRVLPTSRGRLDTYEKNNSHAQMTLSA